MKKIISLAPARTCLFGDHQDYLGLPIIACAINRYIKLTAIAKTDSIFLVKLVDIHQERRIAINTPLNDIASEDYLVTALKVVKRYGCIPTIGYTIRISGNIPINAGLSSSSALTIVWIQFLLEAFGCSQEITPELIAHIAYEVEVVEQGSSGGKMDQYSICLGNIIYLETGNTVSYKIINTPLTGMIIGESGIPKNTLSLLKKLKKQAWLAISKVTEIENDFSIENARIEKLETYLSYVSEDLKPYLYAAIKNYDITKKALQAFQKEVIDLQTIGELMNQHHYILKNKLQITVPRIDAMITAANNAGAYGAKIVGSGKGGSIVALAPKNKERAIISAIVKAGAVNAYEVSVDSGARIIKDF